MGALPNGHDRNPMCCSAFRDEPGGFEPGDLPEAETAVEVHGRALVGNRGDGRGGLDVAGRQPRGVHRHQMGTVRIDPAQIRFDEQSGDDLGLICRHARAAQDAGKPRAQRIRRHEHRTGNSGNSGTSDGQHCHQRSREGSSGMYAA